MKATANVLLTGFDPFGGETINPSWEAVRLLDGEDIDGRTIRAVQLPTVFGRSLTVLRAAVKRWKPELVICVGQAGGRAQLSLERVAINVDDARIPDNAGKQPIDRAIVRGGPTAYFSTLPIKAIRAVLADAALPAEISQTAGTFVCNHVFYGLMHALASTPDVRGGFVHIPFLPVQAARHAGAPSLAQNEVVRALRLIVATTLAARADRRVVGGATH
jgi:pyroglutamyl-peptidase